MVHTEPRYTKDLDIWIEPTEPNAKALLVALGRFGVPLNDIQPADFTQPDVFFQIDVDPVRVDMITVDFGGELGFVLCREDVIAAKRATGRARDKRETPAPRL
jgi:hypothetical protein